MRKSALLLLALLAFSVCSAEPKAGIAAEIDALIAAAQVDEHTPGAAVLVVLDGRKIFEKGYGLAHLKPEVPIRPHTVFELASCTKQFTAMAVMMLAERGKLQYTDNLSTFFPEFTAFGSQVTVEHLLHHTSGLPDYMDAWDKSSSKKEPTSRAMLHLLAKEPKLRFAPGEKFEYSNSGYMVLAQIVEKASGKKYPEFLKENIFEPLGMRDTLVFDETKPRIPRQALCYARKGGEWSDTSQNELNAVYGDGSVRSSIEDLFKWDQALYTEKLVKATTLDKAFTAGKLKDGSATGYGFGWGVGKFHGTREVSHSGSWLDFNTSILRLPERKLAVIVLSNHSKFNADAIAHKIAALVLKAEK